MAHDGGLAALSFPYGDEIPESGTTIDVAPGVKWLRMPLPFVLNHINLWLLEDRDGWAIVDTGLSSEPTRAIWERIFETELDGRPVTRVIVTHFHPDHMGNAGWLCRRFKVPLHVSETEWLWARSLSLDADDASFHREQAPFYRRAGLEDHALDGFTGRGNRYRPGVSPVPRSFHRLSDGQQIDIGGRSWRVVVGRGHSPEHACLYCAELGVLISGDQVLPKISPNVGVWPTEPEGDPLSFYLASLEKLRQEVSGDVLVLPSHNLPFRGLDTRIDQLLRHHEQRLDALEAACARPQTAAELVPVLFSRALDSHQLGFAIGETLAHLQCLRTMGRIRRRTRPDGVWIYERS
ncbi:MAG: MBL fold metallo-hydrolase [Rhodospirillales bacterium]|nr:MBL fold metallo-hydrolase [Rhodospirillales bacterium]